MQQDATSSQAVVSGPGSAMGNESSSSAAAQVVTSPPRNTSEANLTSLPANQDSIKSASVLSSCLTVSSTTADSNPDGVNAYNREKCPSTTFGDIHASRLLSPIKLTCPPLCDPPAPHRVCGPIPQDRQSGIHGIEVVRSRDASHVAADASRHGLAPHSRRQSRQFVQVSPERQSSPGYPPDTQGSKKPKIASPATVDRPSYPSALGVLDDPDSCRKQALLSAARGDISRPSHMEPAPDREHRSLDHMSSSRDHESPLHGSLPGGHGEKTNNLSEAHEEADTVGEGKSQAENGRRLAKALHDTQISDEGPPGSTRDELYHTVSGIAGLVLDSTGSTEQALPPVRFRDVDHGMGVNHVNQSLSHSGSDETRTSDNVSAAMPRLEAISPVIKHVQPTGIFMDSDKQEPAEAPQEGTDLAELAMSNLSPRLEHVILESTLPTSTEHATCALTKQGIKGVCDPTDASETTSCTTSQELPMEVQDSVTPETSGSCQYSSRTSAEKPDARVAKTPVFPCGHGTAEPNMKPQTLHTSDASGVAFTQPTSESNTSDGNHPVVTDREPLHLVGGANDARTLEQSDLQVDKEAPMAADITLESSLLHSTEARQLNPADDEGNVERGTPRRETGIKGSILIDSESDCEVLNNTPVTYKPDKEIIDITRLDELTKISNPIEIDTDSHSQCSDCQVIMETKEEKKPQKDIFGGSNAMDISTEFKRPMASEVMTSQLHQMTEMVSHTTAQSTRQHFDTSKLIGFLHEVTLEKISGEAGTPNEVHRASVSSASSDDLCIVRMENKAEKQVVLLDSDDSGDDVVVTGYLNEKQPVRDSSGSTLGQNASPGHSAETAKTKGDVSPTTETTSGLGIGSLPGTESEVHQQDDDVLGSLDEPTDSGSPSSPSQDNAPDVDFSLNAQTEDTTGIEDIPAATSSQLQSSSGPEESLATARTGNPLTAVLSSAMDSQEVSLPRQSLDARLIMDEEITTTNVDKHLPVSQSPTRSVVEETSSMVPSVESRKSLENEMPKASLDAGRLPVSKSPAKDAAAESQTIPSLADRYSMVFPPDSDDDDDDDALVNALLDDIETCMETDPEQGLEAFQKTKGFSLLTAYQGEHTFFLSTGSSYQHTVQGMVS